jgi:hypothetical protein
MALYSQEEVKARQMQLMEKYEKTVFFQKLSDEDSSLSEGQKMQLAMLLENQKHAIKEYTTTGNIKANSSYTLPMVRRIYPNLISQGLVGVQVLPQPSASVWYMDFHYDTDVAPIQRGDRMDYQVNQGRNANDARFYTAGQARGAVIGTGDGTRTEFVIPRVHTPRWESTFTPVHPNANLQVYVDSQPQDIKFEGDPAAGEVLVVYATGDIIFGTAPALNAQVTADYDLRFEGDDSRIPELNLSMTSQHVTTRARKLKARWTLEAEQDFQAYHGLNIEAELTAAASREIGMEIDREIIMDLAGAASENVNWTYTWPGAASGFTRVEYDETLIRALYEAEHRIFAKRRVQPNWLIAGSDVAVRLQAMRGFNYAGDAQGGPIQQGPRRTGTFQNRYNLIVDPLFPANTILMGYKGATPQEAGYLYCPYVGLLATDTFMDPNDFTPRKGWMRRDGKWLVSNDFYATVTLVP